MKRYGLSEHRADRNKEKNSAKVASYLFGKSLSTVCKRRGLFKSQSSFAHSWQTRRSPLLALDTFQNARRRALSWKVGEHMRVSIEPGRAYGFLMRILQSALLIFTRSDTCIVQKQIVTICPACF